ncbi:hypothetical protein J2Y55_004595 [Bosea sp. BE125]|uniref:hypothetical protein n=1 Tax=Bosea sp. BE125 TaxID=2817909 RepID=UPI0028553EF4|nr:hypothetical protein [Bosea sp. BE125]MDR6873568.1 hypothetical protein [Bosea sp. BE125]
MYIARAFFAAMCLAASIITTGHVSAQPIAPHSAFVGGATSQERLIVFVHGLGNSGGASPLSAWSSAAGKPDWPTLMSQDPAFSKNFAIFVYQYGTKRFNGNFHIQGLSEEASLTLKNQATLDKFQEIYFISHSLGGVLVRHLLSSDEALRKKTKGIFLFASPMGGSDVANVANTLGIAGVQTAQLGAGPDNPDAVFNTIKDNWFKQQIRIPSYCAYETEKTNGVTIVVRRSSVEPLCSHAVTPIRGAHSEIIAPPDKGVFAAHELVRGWLSESLKDFQDAAKASEKDDRVVIANCNGNEAYRGPYGAVHTRLKGLLADNGIRNARYSLPLSQTWMDDRSRASFYSEQEPSHIIIHLSCFQNTAEGNAQSIEMRDRNFLAFLQSFRTTGTKIIAYSRAFRQEGCPYIREKVQRVGLADNYRGRLTMVAIGDREVPGDGGPGDGYLLQALGRGQQPSSPTDCIGARQR